MIQQLEYKWKQGNLGPHNSTLLRLILPKILGTYEKEIINDLLDLCKDKKIFIDIGCAEGYYTTGIAATTNIARIIGIDINETALKLAKESAKLNNIEHKCKFMSDIVELPQLINGATLIMIDVDGSEIEVLKKLLEPLTENQKQYITEIVLQLIILDHYLHQPLI